MDDNVILFVPRPRVSASERLRLRMVEEARARYEAIFPPDKSQDTAPPNPDNLA